MSVNTDPLAKWVAELAEHAVQERAQKTRESSWDADWDFLVSSKQWSGSLPTYRYPIVVNVWRRDFHQLMAVLTGGRPVLKIVPQGMSNPANMEVWQHALWSVIKTERIMERWGEAIAWGLIGDGGWLKVGYGSRDPNADQPDVLVSCPHPSKILPDPDCTDPSLRECGYILYEEEADLSVISQRYPERGHEVMPDKESSWVGSGPTSQHTGSIASAASSPTGWSQKGGFQRARAIIRELWIDDSTMEHYTEEVVTDIDLSTGQPTVKKVDRWKPKYPYGRVITCTKDVVLRDIPNPFGSAFGHNYRWPFVFVPMAEAPHRLWRPGLASDQTELQRAINKMQSLMLENSIKCTNAIMIRDRDDSDDEDITLFPGCTITKDRGSEVKVVFPQPLPAAALQFQDQLIRRMSECIGLADPPVSPGQAVAAKTVSFMQQKGHFLLGEMAKLAESSLEQLGQRIAGLQRSRYLPGRRIPMFSEERIQQPAEHAWPELPDSLQVRVEASSGWQEQIAALMAQAAASDPRQGKPKR